MTQDQYKKKNFTDHKPSPESGQKGGGDFINNADHPLKSGRKIKGHGKNPDSDTESSSQHYSNTEEQNNEE